MFVPDVILVFALLLLLYSWFRRFQLKPQWPWVCVLVVIGISAWCIAEYRWQAWLGLVAVSVVVIALILKRAFPAARIVMKAMGCFISLSVLLAIAGLYLFPIPDLPQPSGPHAVGVKTVELIDRDRLGVFTQDKQAPRRLLVRVWYPAIKPAQHAPQPYFSEEEARYTIPGIGEFIGFAPLFTYMRNASTNAYANAALIPDAKQLPTVFFSHGYASSLGWNTVLMELLASHGYVVYSIQHTYDALPTVFPDHSIANTDPALIRAARQSSIAAGVLPPSMAKSFSSASITEQLRYHLLGAEEMFRERQRLVVQSAPVWVQDRLFVHDQLEQGKVPQDMAAIAAASNWSRTAEMGLSFGGSVSAAVCLLDKRCGAVVNIDGGDFHYQALNANIGKPMLMLHSDINLFYQGFGLASSPTRRSLNDFAYERFEEAGQHADIYRLQLKGVTHNGLSDFNLFLRKPLSDFLIGPGPGSQMLALENDLILQFLDKHLRGKNNAFPQEILQRNREWVSDYSNQHIQAWWNKLDAAEKLELSDSIDSLKSTVMQNN